MSVGKIRMLDGLISTHCDQFTYLRYLCLPHITQQKNQGKKWTIFTPPWIAIIWRQEETKVSTWYHQAAIKQMSVGKIQMLAGLISTHCDQCTYLRYYCLPHITQQINQGKKWTIFTLPWIANTWRQQETKVSTWYHQAAIKLDQFLKTTLIHHPIVFHRAWSEPNYAGNISIYM